MDLRNPLETLFREALGRPVRLVWTDNRSVYLSVRPGRGAETVVRLHRSFRAAPPAVHASLTRYLSTRRRSSLQEARSHFEQWLRASSEEGERRSARRLAVRPEGHHYHLGEVLEEVCGRALFASLPLVHVSWGVRRRPGTVNVRLGSYHAPKAADGVALIRIHPVLDHPDVPRMVVKHIVHHELAHHFLSCTLGGVAARRHGKEFRRIEELDPRHAEVEAWLRKELPGLLVRARQRRRRP